MWAPQIMALNDCAPPKFKIYEIEVWKPSSKSTFKLLYFASYRCDSEQLTSIKTYLKLFWCCHLWFWSPTVFSNAVVHCSPGHSQFFILYISSNCLFIFSEFLSSCMSPLYNYTESNDKLESNSLYVKTYLAKLSWFCFYRKNPIKIKTK